MRTAQGSTRLGALRSSLWTATLRLMLRYSVAGLVSQQLLQLRFSGIPEPKTPPPGGCTPRDSFIKHKTQQRVKVRDPCPSPPKKKTGEKFMKGLKMESFPTLCSPFPHMPLSELPRSPSGWEESFPWGWERTFRRVLPVPTVTRTGAGAGSQPGQGGGQVTKTPHGSPHCGNLGVSCVSLLNSSWKDTDS